MEDLNVTIKEPNKEWNLQVTPKFILIRERYGTMHLSLSYDEYPKFIPQSTSTYSVGQDRWIEDEGIFVSNTFKMYLSYAQFYDDSGVADNKGNISLEMNDMSIQFRIPYYLAKCLANAAKGIVDLEGTEEGITFLD